MSYGNDYSNKPFERASLSLIHIYWFVKEQGEDETNAENRIKKMELFGNDSKGLYLLDSELAARVYTAPSLVL